MNKTTLLATIGKYAICAGLLFTAIEAKAGYIKIDKTNASQASKAYYTFTQGNRSITPCAWGMNGNPTAVENGWVAMSWNDTNNFNGSWTAAFGLDKFLPNYRPYAWMHVEQKISPKKCDSSMKSKFSFSYTTKSSSNPVYSCNFQSYGSEDSTGKLNQTNKKGFDIMIRPDYAESTQGSKVTVDGQSWYKHRGEDGTKLTLHEGVWCYRVTTVYWRVNKTKSTSVNVKPFMENAGLTGWTLGQMQVGWEVYNGSGDFHVSSMSISP